MRKLDQNSLKKHAMRHSKSFELQSIATSNVIWILTHLYSLDKYVNVLYMQLKSSETMFGQFKSRKRSPNSLKTHLEQEFILHFDTNWSVISIFKRLYSLYKYLNVV